MAMVSRGAKAQAIVDALDAGIVTERPRYREATVLACVRCGHRFAIALHAEAERQTHFPCACGGEVKIKGYYARLEPRKGASNG